MTENMKKFLEAVSADREKAEKVSSVTKETLIAMAKELGIELTNADFEQKNELSDDELDAVAGGGDCLCIMGGGGEGDDDDKTCACVLAGYGKSKEGQGRCACPVGGQGYDN